MDFKLPEMSKGTIIPNGITEQQLKEAEEKKLRKQQWRHDYRVALFSAAIGGLFGFIASLITMFVLQ